MSALIGDPRVFVSELIWTVINFVLLMLLLKRFLFQPILTVMEKRKAGMDEKHQLEQEARRQAEENQSRLQAEQEASREEAKKLQAQSADERAERHAAAMAAARKEAEQLRLDGEAALKRKQEQEQAALGAAAPELAEVLAKRLLQED